MKKDNIIPSKIVKYVLNAIKCSKRALTGLKSKNVEQAKASAVMEVRQSIAGAGPTPSQALTPPEGQSTSVAGMQQANPVESVANTAVRPSPSVAPRKPRGRYVVYFKTCMSQCVKSFQVGLRKLWILLWKNLLFRLRSFVLLIFQILMIGWIFGFLFLFGPPSGGRGLLPSEQPREWSLSVQRLTAPIPVGYGRGFPEIIFFVSKNDPNGNGLKIVQKIGSVIDNREFIWIEVSSEKVIEDEYGKAFLGERSHFWGAVVFEKLSRKEVIYKIRPSSPEDIGAGPNGPGGQGIRGSDVAAQYDTNNLFVKSRPGPNTDHEDAYRRKGILALQILIDDAAIKVLRDDPDGLKRDITLKTFPYPPYEEVGFYSPFYVSVFCGMFFFYLAFSNPFLSMNVGNEKQTGVKELMKLCGYPGWMQWLAWYMIMFLVDLIILAIFQLMLKTIPVGLGGRRESKPYLKHSDYLLCLFILLLTMISNNAFVIFICSLLKSTALATLAAIIIPIAVIVPVAIDESDSYSTLMAVSLLPHACFANAYRFILSFEGDGHGAQWASLDETLPNLPKLNLGLLILMFLVDIVIYQSLAVYIEAILPSEYGVRKPVYYPIKALFAPILRPLIRWTRRKPGPMPGRMAGPPHPIPIEGQAGGFEPDPGHGKPVGVEVKNLVKKFDGHKIAVNGVSSSFATIIVTLDAFAIILPIAWKESTSFSMLMAVSLLPQACFTNAIRYIFEFERAAHGAQWNWLAETLPNVPKLNLGLLILMFLIDIVLYQSLAVYVEAILPSEYGVRKPVYYPIKALLAPILARIRRKGKAVPNPSQVTVLPTESKAGGFEPPPGNEKLVGVHVRNLVKKFDGTKIAVNGVSMKLYDGEIFALLGHNGAGKTTLISMLTGLFAPTSGSAIVYGHDIKAELDKVRQNLGLCPQHDMLFNNLTVMEHLRIFGQIKGQKSSLVKQEALGLLNMMNLAEKKNTLSKKLSGGQKRRLCLGMALIGGAKVVILDEPTSGMDPEARRAIWDILLQIRGQRTILLTTHFMEEADVLGDRIGIMAEGKLQCCGSPTFLKSFYGTGYTLKVALLPDADKNVILEVVQKSIPDATLKPINIPNEAFISLPTETASPSALSSLFTALTEKKDEMHIESLGLSVASMDEIFVKVGELSGRAAVEAKEEASHAPKSPKSKASVRTQAHKKGKEEHDHGEAPDSATIAEVPVPTLSQLEAGVQPVDVGSGDPKPKSTPSAAPSKQNSVKSKAKPKRFGSFLIYLKKMLRSIKMTLVQAVAILIKRFICTKRKIGFLLFQILAPTLMTLGAVLVINETIDPGPSPPPLKIGLDGYRDPLVLYSDAQNQIRAVSKAMSPSPKRVRNIENELWNAAKEDISYYRESIIAAGEIVSDTDYTAWFNTIPLHAAPLAINLASNIRGRELIPPIKFQMTNYPLKTRGAMLIKKAAYIGDPYKIHIKLGMSIDLSGFMSTALVLLVAFFKVLPTEERLNKSRQLQLMTGIHPLIYWGIYFLWDFFVLLTVTTIMITVLVIFESFQIFSFNGALGAIFLTCLSFGSAVIPLAYMVSNIPKSVPGSVTILLLLLIIPFIVTFCLNIGIGEDGIAEAVMALCRIVPLAGATLSFILIGTKFPGNVKCNFLGEGELATICSSASISGANEDELKNLWPCCSNCKNIPGVTWFHRESYINWNDGKHFTADMPGVGQIALCLFIMSLIFLALHIMFELGTVRFIRSLLTKGIKPSDFLEQVDDEDVRVEEHRVAEMIATKNTSADALVVDTLCKNYGGLSAVSKLTFGVHHGECFGLLGTNGAGKTTTFRMITGDELPSLGDVHESRFTLKRNRRKIMSQIGYCPQFDAFIPYLTGNENLQLFARLRGIPWRQVNKEAAKLLESVGLTASGNVQCGKYSGGMKRRLSAAIAIIGNPALILLDEPTSGVDPVSRRQFWKVLEAVKGHGQSIILTSHSMDECEALCARLGIMVNGQLQCIGGVQHLKHKFAQGYSLTLRLKSITDPQQQQYAMGMLGSLNYEITEKFHPCMLKDQHETVLQYQIENTALGWNVIYNNLEELKKSYGDIMEDYSVSETSLEEVFLAFSRKQYPPRDSKIPLCRRIWTCQY